MPRISITVKNAIVYFFLLAFTSLVLGYSIYRISSNKILENATLSLNHNNESVVTQFNTFLEDIRRDIWFLSENPFLYAFLTNRNDQELKNNLSKELLSLLAIKKHYFQIRLIGLDQKGKEIIRAEKFIDSIGLVDNLHLQEKGERDYFRETIQLPKDSLYFSEINLNQEYGKIIMPMVPTMRVAKPIFQNDKIFGILIINIDLSYVFNELKKIAGAQYNLRLINSNGYYLIHPDSSLIYGFEFDKAPSIFPANTNQDILQGLLSTENEIYAIQDYFYPRDNYHLHFCLSANKNILLSVFNQWKSDIILLTLFLTLISLFIAWWWTQRQTKEFKSITKTIINFGKNPENVKLQIDRDDEIGDLANSFQEMANKINLNLTELKIAKTEAIEANKAKSEFLENMSHEIRNPLQSILGMTGMLNQNKPRPDQQVFIDTLKFSSDTLLTLVNDILDYRKLIHGQIELNIQKTALKEYIDNILKSHLLDASNKKIKLKLNLDPILFNKFIFTDPIRLGQILHNLLSNAIRHSRLSSEVCLSLQLSSKETLLFSIEDHGSGLSAANIENILNQKPVTGESRQTQNVGLGLPIVINLLKLFDSKLEIISNENAGASFTFSLKSLMQEIKNLNEWKDSSSLNLKSYIQTVACIDDDAQNTFFYSQVFTKYSIQTNCFNSPEIFLKNENLKYDLIISDLNFPDTKLKDHLVNFKKALNEKGILILISATDDIDAILGELKFQFDLILQKPISTEILIKELTTIIFQKNYEAPQLQNLYNNYDYQLDKVLIAFELTLSEWKEMSTKLIHTIQQQNMEEFDKVYHKVINSIRTFELHSFQKLLDTLRFNIETQNADVPALINKVSLPLISYQKIFEVEISKLKSSQILNIEG
ncbi:MAG: hypothetical protein IPO78_12615 [Saprospiraceae bacterium]|nr:hypothetical protein [Saprospiraceae bacterium]MBK9722442.1 hypothetical protein [Saprospiraceae bacterium]